MRKPAALYPFCSELLPVVRHFEKLQEQYYWERVISPEGLGLVGKDAGHACNHRGTGIFVSDTSDLSSQPWDKLFITEINDIDIVDVGMETRTVLWQALELGRDVSYFSNSKNNIPEEIWNYNKVYSQKINFRIGNICNGNKVIYHRYGEVRTPVVLVGGIFTEADVLEVLLQLVVKVREDGLNPMVLTRCSIGQAFGFHSMNHIFGNLNLSESEKIVELNLYIRNLEFYEMPDLIIMEAPDAIMQFNEYDPNGFGIHTYMLCHAIPPDYFICCVPCILGNEEFIEAISYDMAIRLGAQISAVHVSNLLVDPSDLFQNYKLSYARRNLKAVRDQLKRKKEDSKILMCDVVEDSVDEIYKLLLQEVML